MTLLNEAICFAVACHEYQLRKGTGLPYIVHPMEVLEIVCRLTDDEDVRAAAVLHDTVEDTGASTELIKERFGERVAELVAAESEDKRIGRPKTETWRERKQETIDHLKSCGDKDVKLIAFADKLANLRSMSRDLADIGDKMWERFNVSDRDQNVWYYGSILECCPELKDRSLYKEYEKLMQEIWG